MVLGIEGIRRGVDVWNGTALTTLDFVLIGCLPFIAWLWWRFASPFGQGRGQCLAGQPQDETTPDAPSKP